MSVALNPGTEGDSNKFDTLIDGRNGEVRNLGLSCLGRVLSIRVELGTLQKKSCPSKSPFSLDTRIFYHSRPCETIPSTRGYTVSSLRHHDDFAKDSRH